MVVDRHSKNTSAKAFPSPDSRYFLFCTEEQNDKYDANQRALFRTPQELSSSLEMEPSTKARKAGLVALDQGCQTHLAQGPRGGKSITKRAGLVKLWYIT